MDNQQNLILCLPFKEFTQRDNHYYVIDDSGNSRDALIIGNGSIVSDERFGSCLYLQPATPGTEESSGLFFIEDFELVGNFYVELWVKLEAQADQIMVNLNSSAGNLFTLGYRSQQIWTSVRGEQNVYSQSIPTQEWTHIGIAIAKPTDNEPYQSTLYFNGTVAATVTLSGSANQTNLRRQTQIDFKSKVTQETIQGSVSTLNIYSGIVTQKEIVQSMNAAYTSQSLYKTQYPLDFQFDDNGATNVLYIGNTNDAILETTTFDITNTSNSILELTPLQKSSRESFHFELRFRPNTFAHISSQNQSKSTQTAYIQATALPEGWIASDATINPTTQYLSLYFSYTGTSRVEFAPEETLTFNLEYGSADGNKGGRSTQVLLLYSTMTYKGANTPLSGKRLKSFEVVNVRGKKNIPLHAGFLGSNTVLNDSDSGSAVTGTTCSVTLRLKNTLSRGKVGFLTGKETTGSNVITRFTLTFDPPSDFLALGNASELGAIQVGLTGNWASVVRSLQGNVPVFTIDNFQITDIPAGQSLDIEINNIQSSKASGFSNIYLHYENIPGYWDGDFVFVVEKTPIIHRNITTGQKEEKKVGIGTMPETGYQLKVGGNLRIEPDTDDTVALSIGSKDKTQSFLSVDPSGKTGIRVEGAQLDLAIGDNDTGLQQLGEDQLGIYTNNQERMRIDTQGNVGVGIAKPTEKFEVAGRIKDSTGYLTPPGVILPFAGPKAKIPSGFLACDGQLVAKNSYPDLYQAIGDAWGVEGDQFRLPDLRGYFLRGVSDTSGKDPDSDQRKNLNPGGTTGNQVGTYQDTAMASHSHSVSIAPSGNHEHKLWTYNGSGIGSNNDNNWVVYNDDGPQQSWKGKTDTVGNHTHTAKADSSGGNETRPINAAVWYIIKY